MKKNYEEKMIDEVLYYRTSALMQWTPVSRQLKPLRFDLTDPPKRVSPSPAAPEVQNVNDNSVLYY